MESFGMNWLSLSLWFSSFFVAGMIVGIAISYGIAKEHIKALREVINEYRNAIGVKTKNLVI
jgi:hypothetical protein